MQSSNKVESTITKEEEANVVERKDDIIDVINTCKDNNDAVTTKSVNDEVEEKLYYRQEYEQIANDMQQIVNSNLSPESIDEVQRAYTKMVPEAFKRSDTFFLYDIYRDKVKTGLSIVLHSKMELPAITLYFESRPAALELVFTREEKVTEELEKRWAKMHSIFVREICLSGDVPVVYDFYLISEEYDENSPAATDMLKAVVKTKYTNRHYTAKQKRYDFTPLSSFGTKTHANFAAYFKDKYGMEISDLNQPLLEVYQQTRIRNFVSPDSTGSTYDKERSTLMVVPELLEITNFPVALFDFLHCIPSFIYLLESYVLAYEFKTRMELSTPVQGIRNALIAPCSGIPENYERLEFLGDNVLKLLTCTHLFRAHPDKSEGQLTFLKNSRVSNLNLFNKACQIQYPSYMHALPFMKKDWFVQRRVQQTFSLKTIADSVEAMIGACYLHGVLKEATKFCVKLGLEVDQEVYEDSIPAENVFGSAMIGRVTPVEPLIDYEFKNKSLLVQALTHPSYNDKLPNYQRLEFLGDAVLDLVAIDYIFREHPTVTPAELTVLKSEIVNNNSLAACCEKYGFYRYLNHQSEQVSEELALFRMKKEVSQDAPKILGDLFESIAGAVFVDCGFDLETVKLVFGKLIHELLVAQKESPTIAKHPVSELQELCQKHLLNLEFVYEKSGKQEVICKPTIEGIPVGSVSIHSRNKKNGRKEAAKICLELLKSSPNLLQELIELKNSS